MSVLSFTRNESPSIGVEVELQLVDRETYELKCGIDEIIARLPDDLAEHVKPELMQCYLEINTGICRTVADVRNDLNRVLVQ